MSPSPQAPRSTRRPKSTLFCPDCGHEGPLRGDWVVRRPPGRLRTACPDCGAVVDDRPRASDRAVAERPSARPTPPVFAPVTAFVGIQRSLLEWWTGQVDHYASFATA